LPSEPLRRRQRKVRRTRTPYRPNRPPARPAAAAATEAPPSAYVVVSGGIRYQYFNGAFYAPRAGGYAIVAPPPGIIVPGIPQGYAQQRSTCDYGGVAYREVLVPDGEPGCQVVGP
jgi:hypothetical protein